MLMSLCSYLSGKMSLHTFPEPSQEGMQNGHEKAVEIGHFRVVLNLPHFQNESPCETIQMKMSLICMKIDMQVKLIFIWMVSQR